MPASTNTANNTPWKFCIDTGGTFTDCIATTPDGEILRCKVLSSSAIRGIAQPVGEPGGIRLHTEFSLPDNFFKGYRFRLLSNPDTIYRITGSGQEASIIITDNPVQFEADKSEPFEILSSEEAPVFAARLITGTPLNEPLPPIEMRLATTKGTNALLERRGGKTLMLVTEGYKDLLKIRNQQRPELFALNIEKPEPYYSYIIEVPERLNADGTVLKPIDIDQLRKRVEPVIIDFDAAGICLMHSYLNPEHELEIEKLLQELGVKRISRSSDLSKTIRIVPRAIATDVNAFLSPVMEQYLDRIRTVIRDSSLRVMTSAGHLAEANSYKPKDGLLSGPAGGVIGAAAIGGRVTSSDPQSFNSEKDQNFHDSSIVDKENFAGLGEGTKIISFDMGGTSTDVARYDGSIETIYEHTVGDALISAPAVDIETVAAGGGSVCAFDGISLIVGPESAGADPGPACYGRGGPLTITDVNLLSGRLHTANFHISILPDAAEVAFQKIEQEINRGRDEPLNRKQILEGFLDIANERMAQAIRKISIQKGFDPADYTLVAFGGAGAQHAIAVAEKLGIGNLLVPSDAGLLSAYGLQQAKLEQIATAQVLKPLNESESSLPHLFQKTEKEATDGLIDQGALDGQIDVVSRLLSLRLKGQDTSLEIEWDEKSDINKQFEEAYRKSYGHWIDDREIELEAIRVKVSENSGGNAAAAADSKTKPGTVSEPVDQPFTDSFGNIFRSESIRAGDRLTGPSLVLNSYSTTVIEKGWKGTLLEDGTWLIQPTQKSESSEKLAKERSEAVNLQLFTNRFRSVADQMGEMLRRISMSVNVKERLDYSCALLDTDGYLVVNAPHIPVHLGAMGTCVRSIISYTQNLQGLLTVEKIRSIKKDLGGFQFEEGDVLITNHPAFGGSHLPDVTVVTPVFFDGKRIGFVASRAHHAEIGGKRPGSMPPDAMNLAEEGVVIPPIFLAKKGKYNWNEIENLLKENRWPSRSPEENLADIRAAVAANHRGAEELKSLANRFGEQEVTSYMKKLKKYAEGRMRATLGSIKDGTYEAEEKLDDGSILKAKCTVDGDFITFDFTGTSPVHPGNLNANPSIVNSVIIYLLRLMVDEPLPLNDGLFEPVKIILPKCMLNPAFPDDPEECPAVVGGNIETSQRLTDTLQKAFGLAACSYGTMNNVLFGNETFGYYETVAGGTGAGDRFHGADAVHQHMTNTRAADPEILEQRYPVRLDRYAIRHGSGGQGKWYGGNGIIRELTFLEPVSLSVLAQHRVVPPYGLNGGNDGLTGVHYIERKNGTKKELRWRDGAELEIGDRFILHTPGGGGFDGD